MIFARRVIALTALLQISAALVEFKQSRLYDETDFKTNFNVDPPNFCDVGCRVYVSVPSPSAEIAKLITMKDDANAEISLFDISLRSNGDQKGFYEIATGTQQISFANNNAGLETAPIAVWIVQTETELTFLVYDAANLKTAAAPIDVVTVMSAEPFTLRTKTQGPIASVATLSGYDAVYGDSGDDCAYPIFQTEPETYKDVQVFVQSPLISLFYDRAENPETKVAVIAEVGSIDTLDFSDISFVASPGYMCKGEKNYISSLYKPTTAFTYYKCGWQYDVDVATTTNADNQNPVTLKDTTNNQEYKWPGTDPDTVKILQTNSLDITWTNDKDKSFFISLTPSNAQKHAEQGVICETTTSTEPERTTTPLPDDISDGTTTVSPDQPDHTDPPVPVKTTTAKSDQPDHTDPEQGKTTTTTIRPTTSALKTVHPKDISSTMTSTLTPTTSGSTEYGLAFVFLAMASVFYL